MKREDYAIDGMVCASCSLTIEKAVSKLAGVSDVSVNLTTEKMNVAYDPKSLDEQKIISTVVDAGYGAKRLEGTSDEIEQRTFSKTQQINKLWSQFFYSAIFTVPLLYLAMGSMLGFWLPGFIQPNSNPRIFVAVELILAIPVVILNIDYFKIGFKTLAKGHPNMDSLVALGSGAALVYSFFGTFQVISGNYSYSDDLYYEAAGTILTLITLGKYFETVSKGKTSTAIKKLLDLAPKTANVIINGQEEERLLSDVKVGDIVIVRPGQKIPADGQIIEGNSTVDESLLTGESMPISKKLGDSVFGGSLNQIGSFKFRITKEQKETVLSQIIKLVEDAQAQKAPIAKIADKVSAIFVPTVIALALLAGLGWYSIGNESFSFSLTIMIAVLVIACPCALGLATPTAIMVGTGKGADNGVFFKSGTALESLQNIQAIVLDKTGTITTGVPSVTNILSFNNLTKKDVMEFAEALEYNSEHPLAKAIMMYAKEHDMKTKVVSDFQSVAGKGIQAVIDDQTVILGNESLMMMNKVDVSFIKNQLDELALQGKTPLLLGLGTKLAGIIAIADPIKNSSRTAVTKLQDAGIEVIMMTGDNAKTASAIAEQVGIKTVRSEVMPADKANQVQALQAESKLVGMVGDGINDAPALARANVGIAIGSGTDVAIDAADIVLLHSDLLDVVTAYLLSKATIHNIKENLFWAFAYNIMGIPVAMGGLYLFGGPLLNPMIAGAAMSFSSVSVLLNALRLRSFRSVV
ncbi:heavy metal translocating P-type ATPase [Liquorilactobacillus mali]|uniref:Copper-exporting P-type ATPase n=1 Tax=Liquorilactobacillus mali KCTC 3596 = DSM 20444 TaxID=1046596 RepID=J1F464_9LACO|nr:heavy metal translocating P-type ATPase [Liquorilactobacillus mali]EJF00553.1 lead, cadmium, zinc and mercury transporting ATPase/ copper-translocating P-type ATPase [Liquorilactobacillus mali KCTC 3596 = DSM 20444]KRN10166.1 lead, cadmium, zinc and mercury transporting ATPase copper-translocating P-type ATPase [Liquorilactobacillus mali KCTC 3596 = DSM 20444]QFQ74040.1 copper-translocating P-type ATPase [Liquorilactobacillus mali]